MLVQRSCRSAAVIGLLALGANALAGCSSTPGSTPGADERPEGTEVVEPKPGGRLVYGVESDPNGLDPTRNAWDNAGIQLANTLFDPLAAFDANGAAKPYLAESITPDATYTTWTLRLRPGVTFSNGSPLNAAAVVKFLDKLRASIITGPPTKLITETRAVNDLDVRITTARPWASLPVLFAGQGGYVAAPAQLDDPDGTSHPVGTGPFTLRTWEQDRRFELVKNPRYWRRGLPYLDAVDVLVEADGIRRIDMIERGDMDATALTALWELKALDAELTRRPPHLAVQRDTGDAEKSMIMFNTTKPPLDDVRVRRAVGYATDIPALAAANGWPLDRLARGPIDPTSPYFSPASYPDHDIERAKALVREYLSDRRVRNRPTQVTFSLLANDGSAEFLNQLAGQWAQAGIVARPELVDRKQMVRRAVLGDFDAASFRYFAAEDPDVLWHFFVGETIGDPVSLNFTRFRDDEVTAGMNEGRATPDPAARRQAYTKVQSALADRMPYLWLQRAEWRVATSLRVRDANNVSLPDGGSALPLMAGTFRLTETWVDH